MASMKDEYGRKDRQRICEWVAVMMMINGRFHVPPVAWGWKYGSHAEVYKKPQGEQVAKMNPFDGMTLLECPRAVPWKTCNNCGNEYPAEYPYFHNDRTSKYGVKSICATCVRGYVNNRYREQTSALPA